MITPDGEGPFPAVVIMHDCSGLGPFSSGAPGRWARELLAGAGIDSVVAEQGASYRACLAADADVCRTTLSLFDLVTPQASPLVHALRDEPSALDG